jgi:hypothetical protein
MLLAARGGEYAGPVVQQPASIVGEAAHAGARIRRHKETDRGHVSGREATSAEDYVDQAATHTAVPISERMDRLELRMGYRLDDRESLPRGATEVTFGNSATAPFAHVKSGRMFPLDVTLGFARS